MNFFYHPEITGSDITLSEEESRHCIRALRLRKNEVIYLVDGRGTLYQGMIMVPDIKKVGVKIVKSIKDYGQRIHYLHIAIAPTKSPDRFEWFLEKATEIGIDEITPITCERSERKTVHTERAERILISAMKQSKRAYLPVLNDMIPFDDFVDKTNARGKIITHCNRNDLPLISSGLMAESTTLIMIGPEGDFTLQEVEIAVSRGFIEASLGPFTYRTETAGIMACHQFNLAFSQ
jgi:16S rRNA (uracil1498-N3)-methyltransferase